MKTDYDTRVYNENTIAHLACQVRFKKPVLKLLPFIPEHARDQIRNIVDYGKKTNYNRDLNIKLVKFLISLGVNFTVQNDEDRTPLHFVIINKISELVPVLLSYDSKLCHIADWHDRTPLHLACYYGMKGAVRQLIEYGADVNSKDKDGRTPEMMAVQEFIMVEKTIEDISQILRNIHSHPAYVSLDKNADIDEYSKNKTEEFLKSTPKTQAKNQNRDRNEIKYNTTQTTQRVRSSSLKNQPIKYFVSDCTNSNIHDVTAPILRRFSADDVNLKRVQHR